MATYWKFKFRGSHTFHLSKELKDQIGTGERTLCGLLIGPIRGSAKTIRSLEGNECKRCVEKTIKRGRWKNHFTVDTYRLGIPPAKKSSN